MFFLTFYVFVSSFFMHPLVLRDYGVCCVCKALCRNGTLYCPVHHRMLRLACLPGDEIFDGLSFPLPAVSGCLYTLKIPLQLLSPDPSVGCRCLPGVSVDSQHLEVMLADTPEVQLGSPSWPLSCCQFSIEKVLGDTAVLHMGNMAQPPQA